MKSNNSPKNHKDELSQLLYERKARDASKNILNFTTFTKPNYYVNWHHELIFSALDRFASRELKRLIICMPPQNGKSEAVSRRLPAYIFGKNPDARIISCSYSADLSSRNNRDVQRVMGTERYEDTFPEVALNESNVRSSSGGYLRNSDIFEIVGYEGTYRSCGIGGGITGMSMDFGIVDDYLKNREEAESLTMRNKIYEWYTDVFGTRDQGDSSILITATRWHEDDLIGRLLDMAKNDPEADQWEVISLPALSEENRPWYDKRDGPEQPLWPQKYSLKWLQKKRANVPTYTWLSLYQQRPSAAAGNLVKKEDFKYCTLENGVLTLFVDKVAGSKKVFLLNQCKIFQTCDPAASEKKTANDFVLATWVQTPDNDLALIDLLKTKLETPKHVPLFKQQYIKYHPQQQWIETDGVGRPTFQLLRDEGLPIAELKTSGHDKLIRFIPAATRITAGVVYFLSGAGWLNGYESELLGFPNTKQNGQVDVTSYAAQVVIEHPFIVQTYETTYIGTSVISGGTRI